MGYTLKIGEALFESACESDGIEATFRIDVENKRFEDAPAYGEPTDYENSRWPSYSSWSDCMEKAGMSDLMFNKEYGLMQVHPGCVPITKEHYEMFKNLYNKFNENNPNSVASYETDQGMDFVKCRVEWLNYWIEWAYNNCKNPAFYNS
jgi:hypothetical protein